MLHSKSTYFYRWGSRKKLSSLTFLIPSVCILALLVGGIVAINPMVNSPETYAVTVTGGSTTGGSTGGDTTPSIALSFPTEGLPEGFNNNAEQVTTAKAGEVAYRSNYFDVTVNNPSWYAVSIRAALGYTSDLVYSGTNAAAITGVGKDVPTNKFKENTWGYALTQVPTLNTEVDDSTLTYSTLPASNSPLVAEDSGYISDGTNTKHYKISFATLFSGDASSGHYTTRVYLSAVTNPGHLAGQFGDIVTMQQMTSSVCASVEEGTTGRLSDTRDGKFYWVAKLADGNCWMTQNLDFDVTDTLSSDTSNVASTVDMTNTSEGVKTNSKVTSIGEWTTNRKGNVFYDPGDYVYSYIGDGRPATSNNNCSNVNSLAISSCANFFARATGASDMHYHVGNFYSWATATAKTGFKLTSGDANQSICPAGWKLPTTSIINNMLSKYGVNGKVSGIGTDGQNYQIYGTPIYSAYSGYINESGSVFSIQDAGKLVRYWTSTPYYYNGSISESAYYYEVGQENVSSGWWIGWMGMPIRCINDPSVIK